MKKCPLCSATYNDETLQFCLEDGTGLVSERDEEATQIRVPITRQSVQESFAPQPGAQKKGGAGMIFALIGGLGLFFILGISAIIGYFIFSGRGAADGPATANASPSLSNPQNTAASPTPDIEGEFNKKLAELEKKLEEQKKESNSRAKTTTPGTIDKEIANIKVPTPIPPKQQTATANSPGDGFLALRSQPNTETGERIMKIPHGERLTILSCNPRKGKSGRWCRVNYQGNTGWAFDSYMIYD